MYIQMRRRINGVLGGLSKEEREMVLRKDIEAIDSILGDKKYLFGDRMTTVCVFRTLTVDLFRRIVVCLDNLQ